MRTNADWECRGLATLAWVLLAVGAEAQEIIAVDALNGNVSSVDVHSGAASLIGSTGLNQYSWSAMARDSSGRLIASYGRFDHPYEIHEINTSTGQATFISQTDLNGIGAMAFGPGDILYVAHDTTTPAGPHPFDLYIVDLVSGLSSRVGATGLTNLASLAYGKGELWGYDGNLGLVRIDPATGLASDVNPSFRGPLDLTESLSFGEGDVLFLVDAGLWVMDKITGVPCLVGSTFYPGVFGGVEFLPGPAPPFALGTLGQTGGPMGAEFVGATPDGQVALLLALGPGGPTPVASGYPCAGTILDLNSGLTLVSLLRADSAGSARIGPAFVPPAAAGSARLQALDLTTCATSNLAQVIY